MKRLEGRFLRDRNPPFLSGISVCTSRVPTQQSTKGKASLWMPQRRVVDVAKRFLGMRDQRVVKSGMQHFDDELFVHRMVHQAHVFHGELVLNSLQHQNTIPRTSTIFSFQMKQVQAITTHFTFPNMFCHHEGTWMPFIGHHASHLLAVQDTTTFVIFNQTIFEILVFHVTSTRFCPYIVVCPIAVQSQTLQRSEQRSNRLVQNVS